MVEADDDLLWLGAGALAARHWREDVALAMMAAVEAHARLGAEYAVRPRL